MKPAFLAAAVMSALFFSSCDEVFQSAPSRALDRAELKYKEGDFRAAAQFYEAAIDGTAQTATLHYKLALLYDDNLNDPVGALHHFQRYLDLDPNGARAREAREFAREAEHKLVTKLSRGALMTQEDSARLKNENLSLRKELAALRAQPRVTASPAAKGGEQKQRPIPPGVRTYTVQPGDTLASISRRFYKTSARWKDIQDANFNRLEGTAKIKPGMTLYIP
jgi:nucleoid-associated protein YgaU